MKTAKTLLQQIFTRRIKEFIKEKILPRKLLVKIQLYRYLHKIQKTAPEKLKARRLLKFDIHVADHCNLNCRGCEHFSCIAEEKFLDPDTFDRDCARISELTQGQLDDISVLGGEPLLHPKLTEFLNIIRKYFKTCGIKIVTNGILLLKQKDEFWENCKLNNAEIIITVYPVKIDHEAIQDRAQKYGIKLRYWGDPGEITKWQRRPLDLQGKQNINDSFRLCYMANGCIQLVDGKLYTCAVIAYIKYFNKYFNKNLEVTEQDYIDIYKVKNIDEVFNFLCKPMPFCRYCNIKKTVLEIKWSVTKKDIREWTSYQQW
ncbi:MAG: 4Fe-4S cluster-binding domain-containing protein [Spirochaetales bacterium]|jgi:organic radical activating enzyme|nr:4Fe-4S cluster-binding domain-containing protein [Spirochaetales bacterium]